MSVSSIRSLWRRWRFAAIVFFLGSILPATCGCQTDTAGPPQGTPRERLIARMQRLPTVKKLEDWPLPECVTAEDRLGLKISTVHYAIHTNLDDPLVLRQLSFFLESAFRAYQQSVGSDFAIDRLLTVYMFKERQQWEDFTRFWTGPRANMFLKITAGAYYVKGACVAYHLSRQSNFSVLAHEGWHQFSDELFAYRLPAWLDEGLATLFEAYQWQTGQVDFDPRFNANRLMALQVALAGDHLYPLETLLTVDAGHIVARAAYAGDTEQQQLSIGTYYAQLYALIRFLREDNYGQRLLGFHRMLDDARRGQWLLAEPLRQEAQQRLDSPTRAWNAQVGPWAFQTYIGPQPQELENAFRAFCHKTLRSVRFQKTL